MITTIHQWGHDFVGNGVQFYAQAVGDYTKQLTPLELDLVSKAVAIRQNTFSTGRYCAKRAMSLIGVEPSQFPEGLLRRSDGSVVWPESCTGSISHTNDWAMSAVTQCGDKYQFIGIDIERIDRVAKDVLRLIATDQERDLLENAQNIRWGRVGLFSIKESLYKCLRPLYGEFIGFKDVELADMATEHIVVKQVGEAKVLPQFYCPSVRLIHPELADRCDERRIDIRLAVLDEYVVSFVGYR